MMSGKKRSLVLTALENESTPSTAFHLAYMAGLNTRQTAAILRGMDCVEAIPVNRGLGYRYVYRLAHKEGKEP